MHDRTHTSIQTYTQTHITTMRAYYTLHSTVKQYNVLTGGAATAAGIAARGAACEHRAQHSQMSALSYSEQHMHIPQQQVWSPQRVQLGV